MLRTPRSVTLLRRAYAHHYHSHHSCRRLLHEDSSSTAGNFLAFSVSNPHSVDPRFGMDMTHAPGYELAADDDPPLVGNQKLADFALRHARLSANQVGASPGYIWAGHVLYPSGIAPDGESAFSWEINALEDEEDEEDEEEDEHGEGLKAKEKPMKASDETKQPQKLIVEKPTETDPTHVKVSPAKKTLTTENNEAETESEEENNIEDTQQPTAIQAKRRYTGGQARRIRKEREQNAAKRARRVRKPRPIRKPENDIPPEDQ